MTSKEISRDQQRYIEHESEQVGGSGQGSSDLNDVTRNFQDFGSQATPVASPDKVGDKPKGPVRFNMVVQERVVQVEPYWDREQELRLNNNSVEKIQKETLSYRGNEIEEREKLLKTDPRYEYKYNFKGPKQSELIESLDLAVVDREKQKNVEPTLIEALNLTEADIKGRMSIKGETFISTYNTDEYRDRMNPKPGEEGSALIGTEGADREKVKAYKFQDAEVGRSIEALNLEGVNRERRQSVEDRSTEALNLEVNREGLQSAEARFNEALDQVTWTAAEVGGMSMDVDAMFRGALKRAVKYEEPSTRLNLEEPSTRLNLEEFNRLMMESVQENEERTFSETSENKGIPSLSRLDRSLRLDRFSSNHLENSSRELEESRAEIKESEEKAIERVRSFNDAINVLKIYSEHLMTGIKRGIDHAWRKTNEKFGELVSQSVAKLQEAGRQMGDAWSDLVDEVKKIAERMNVIGRLVENKRQIDELKAQLEETQIRLNETREALSMMYSSAEEVIRETDAFFAEQTREVDRSHTEIGRSGSETSAGGRIGLRGALMRELERERQQPRVEDRLMNDGEIDSSRESSMTIEVNG
jgi:hypothetical protein